MGNSDHVARNSSLADLEHGAKARVAAIPAGRGPILAAHGLRLGVLLQIDGDAPFGGPRIVRLGRIRLAIARAIAREVEVVVEPKAEPEVSL